MLKRYYLAFCLVIFTSGAYASIWSDVGDCFRDLCSCGNTPVTEIWNGKVIREIESPKNNCPPWNKYDGRDTDNCLVQFEPPIQVRAWSLTHCAERTQESTYFEPKVRVRTQSCNFFACWHQYTTLNWDGDCIIWPGFAGLPLLRICARVAVPAVPPDELNKTGTPADPGYTLGWHLNDVGAREDDTKFYETDGKEIVFNRPKLCAYSDPGLVNLVSYTGVHIDPFDWNPISQPIHKTTALHPLIRSLIFLLDQASSMSGPAMIEKLLEMIGAEDIPGLNVMLSIVKAIGMIFELFTSLVEAVLRAVGTLNGSVDDYEFGCVELPSGPFPPPYCPKIVPFVPTPSTNLICSKKSLNDQTFFDQSAEIPPCVVSKTRNNFVHNTVRVGFDDLIPLCKGENSLETDRCVSLKNFPPSAKAFHTATAQRDMIKPCSGVDDKNVCVSTVIKHSCNISDSSLNGCQDGFRIVYAQKTGGRSVPTNYFSDDLPDCSGTGTESAITCQEVWGINTGQFVDVPLKFPLVQEQTASSLLPLRREVSLHDSEDRQRNFVVSIVNAPTPNNSFDPPFQQEPGDICVTEGNSLVGCEKRTKDGYRVSTYDCSSRHDNALCPNYSYYTPQFIASIEVVEKLNGIDQIINSTSTVVIPLSVNSNPKAAAGQVESIVHLAGHEFSSYMSDIQGTKYTAAPFSGPNSLNPLTIHGTYKDDKKPYDSNGKVTKDAVYLKGLEYVNGQYIQGGNIGCLQLKNTDKCIPSVNDTNCVLAKLLEIDPVGSPPNGGCKDFRMKYPYERICQQTDMNCIKQGQYNRLEIFQCDNQVRCYKNSINPGVEVCRISMDTPNRHDPSPSLGPVINGEDQHYKTVFTPNPDGSAGPDPFDENLYSLRDKTSQELGLCITVPPAFCPPITTASSSTGNATWPRGEIGELVNGICPPGYVSTDPNKPPQRYCLSDVEAKTVAFEKLPSGVGCVEGKGLEYEFDRGTFSTSFPIKNESYDTKTRTGRFTIGAGTFNKKGMCAAYIFNIPNKDNIDSFKIGVPMADGIASYYDEYLIVKVNNQVAFNGPNMGGKVNVPETDILRYLINGNYNEVVICVGAVGAGSLYLTLEYKMK